MSRQTLTQDVLDALLDSGDPVDLSDCDLVDLDLRDRALRGVVLGRRGNSAARMTRCRAERSTWIDCSLVGVVIDGCRLHDAEFRECDLRYSDVESTSLRGAVIKGCDLYRASFGRDVDGTALVIEESSVHKVSWGQASISRSALCLPLLQENAAGFRAFHHRRAAATLEPESAIAAHLDRRHEEAASIWRDLSSHWSGRARHRDASWAYVRAKQHETTSDRPDLVWHRTRGHAPRSRIASVLRAAARWAGGLLAGATCGFGESPLRVVASILTTVLVAASAIATTGTFSRGGEVIESPGASVLLAVQIMTTATPGDVVTSVAGEWFIVSTTAIGVILLGLLGFVLGNRLRNA